MPSGPLLKFNISAKIAVGLIEVQSLTGEILQPQISIAVDLGVGEPRREVLRLSGEGGKQV